DGRRIAIVTGTRMAALLEPLRERLSGATGAQYDVIGVENRFFGPTVTTAGLLAGRDIAVELSARPAYDGVLLPAEARNDDGRFIDDLPFSEFAHRLAPTPVVAGYELISTLSALSSIRYRLSPSSAGRTSASPRSSTVCWVSGGRSSKTSPASPVIAISHARNGPVVTSTSSTREGWRPRVRSRWPRRSGGR